MAAIISPLQQRLPLSRTAKWITRFTVLSNLCHVPSEDFPTVDLASVLFRHAPAHIVAAVPLEPTARVVRVYPSFSSPFGKGLAGIDTEIIQ